MLDLPIDNLTLDLILKRAPTTGGVAAMANNNPGYALNIPVTGTDATVHSWDFQIDSTSFFKVTATGDGAGGIVSASAGVTLPMRLAVGNTAIIGGSTSFESNYAFESTITNFSASTLWSVLTNYVTVSPTGSLVGTEVYAIDNEVATLPGNAQNIGRLQAEYSQVRHQGTGSATHLIGKELYVWIDSATGGNTTNLWCASYASWVNVGSVAQVVDNYCMQLKSGNSGAAGAVITDDITLYIKTPYSTAGTTMTSHIGLRLDNQGLGTTSYAIYSDGGKWHLKDLLEWQGIAAPPLSPAGSGRIYFDSGTNTFLVSENGGAYTDFFNTGTVTTVSVVTANGVSGSVANATTTPAITLTLGAITPTTVNGLTISTTTGTLTLANGSSLITSGGNSITLTSTGATNVTLPTSGTLVSSVTTGNGVSAVNTAGALAFTLGAITPSTVNGNTITTGTGTLTLGASKVATISNTLTFTGTDGSSVAFGTGGTVLYNGGALGTPSSGNLSNCTSLPISTGVSGLAVNVATFLTTPSSANLLAAVTDETGSGVLVFGTAPTLTGALISGTTTISFNGSALLNGNAANNIRMTDATAVGGLDHNLTTTSVTLNTVTQNAASIILQNQTFTAGATHMAVQITPTWVSENQTHTVLQVSATQNGANTNGIQGISITMTKATGATTNGTMNALIINAPSVTGTVTNSNAINITSQTNANITTPRGIRFSATGVANSIVWGNSALQYASTTENVRFADSTNARGIDFNLLAAGVQTIQDTAGGLVLGRSGGSIAFMAGTASAVQTSGANLTNNVTAGGTTDQIDDFTSLTIYATDAPAIRNDIYQLARKLKQVNDALRLYGLLT